MLFGMAALQDRLPHRRVGASRAIAGSALIGFAHRHSRLCRRSPGCWSATASRCRCCSASSMAATVPFRPLMVVAIAALIILADAARRLRWSTGSPPPAARPSPIISAPADPDDRPCSTATASAGSASSSRVELWLVVLADVGADAALVEALARPLPLRPVRMAVAQPRAVASAADAQARQSPREA